MLSDPITRIVNASLVTGYLPGQLKHAVITPLIKKPTMDPQDLANYRLVSGLPFVSKLVERVVLSQFSSHIDFQLLPPSQSAYRRNLSTETALLSIRDGLFMSVDAGHGSALLLLDLSAAFDTVDHQILLKRLERSAGITGSALGWFSSYLHGRTQSVKAGDVISTPSPLLYGVLQGSVLGPSLFSVYTAPVPVIASRQGIARHQFSDDTQDRVEFDPYRIQQEEALDSLALCAAETGDWFTKNRVKLNIDKSLLLYSIPVNKSSVIQPRPLSIGDCMLVPSAIVRNLGVLLDSDLSMLPHVNSVCKSCFYHLAMISRIRKYLDRKSTKMLVHALVISRLDNANSLFYGLPSSVLNKLQRVQNAAVRLIFGASARDHITPLRRELHWLQIEKRIK